MFNFRNFIRKAKLKNFVHKFLKHLVDIYFKERKYLFGIFYLDSDDNGYIDFVEFLIAVNITSHG